MLTGAVDIHLASHRNSAGSQSKIINFRRTTHSNGPRWGGRQQVPLNRRCPGRWAGREGVLISKGRGSSEGVTCVLAARGPGRFMKVETIAQGPSPSTPHPHPFHHLPPPPPGHLGAFCSHQAQWRGGGVLHKGHPRDVPPRLALNRRAHHAMTNHLLHRMPSTSMLYPTLHPPRSATLIPRPPAPLSRPRAHPYHI